MPRHTHPPARKKHSRAHIRFQRERHIERRFRAAKRDGTLDWLHLSPRLGHTNAMRSQDYAAAETALHELVEGLGFTFPPDVRGYGSGIHPEVLRVLERDVLRHVHGSSLSSGSLGALADRDAFWRYSCNCGVCTPTGQPGWRRRHKNRFERELADELAADADEDLVGRANPRIDRRHVVRGWC